MSGASAPSPPSNPLELAPSQPPAAHALAKQPPSRNTNGILHPATAQPAGVENDADTALELEDGSVNFGYAFGAKGKSISGECVFQTGLFPLIAVFVFLRRYRYGGLSRVSH